MLLDAFHYFISFFHFDSPTIIQSGLEGRSPAFLLPPPLNFSDGTHGKGQISLKFISKIWWWDVLETDLLGREDVCVVEVCGVGECDRTKFGESPDYGIVELVDQLPTVFNSL